MADRARQLELENEHKGYGLFPALFTGEKKSHIEPQYKLIMYL